MKKMTVPVFFSADEKYAPYLAVAIASLIDHTNPACKYELHVVYHDMKKRTVRRIASLGDGHENIEVLMTEMKDTLSGISDRKETRLKGDYFTPTIYYRIFLPEMFKDCEKGIYLDSDIVVLGDVAELYKVDLSGNLIGACSDISANNNELFCDYFEQVVGVDSKKYINSGVLLMDFKKMREEEFVERFLYLLNTYDFDTVAPDQDYLNSMCYGRILHLDQIWNAMPTPTKKYVRNPMIVHYNMFFKPWHYDGTMYEEFFWKYANESSFLKDIQHEKRNFTRWDKKGDEKRLQWMADRVTEILGNEVTFRTVMRELDKK